MIKTTDRLIIRNALVKGDDALSIVGIGFLSFFSFNNLYSIWTLLFIALLIFFIYHFSKRLSNRNPHIIIDKHGIELYQEKAIFKWEDIKYAYIDYKRNGLVTDSGTSQHLYIATNQTEIEIPFNNYKYSKKEVKEFLKYFGGERLIDNSKINKAEKLDVLDGDEFSEDIIKLFSTYKISTIISNLIIFIGIIGISIYFQDVTGFRYFIGFGFVVSILLIWYYNYASEVIFKEKKFISNLTNEQFAKLAIMHQLKGSKKQAIGAKSFFIIIAIVIFIISHFVTE